MTHPRSKLLLTAAATACAAAAVLPAGASATVTQTAATAPVANTNIMQLNTDANPFTPINELVHLRGVAPGASDGDLVDARCYGSGGSWLALPLPIPVDGGQINSDNIGIFSLGVPLSIAALDNAPGSGGLGRMCNLRFVPTGTNPLNLAAYAPNAVGVGRLDTFDDLGLSGGPLKNYEAYSHQTGGMYKVTSAGAAGIGDSRVHYGSNFDTRTDGVFENVAELGNAPLPLGILGAGSLALTGFGDPSIGISNPNGTNPRAGMLPFDQSGDPLGVFNQSRVDVQRAVDAAGNATITESSATRICHIALVACTTYDDGGVGFARKVTTSNRGVTATVADTWTNTGVDPVKLDLRYHNRVGDGGNTGIGVGGAAPQQHTTFDALTPGTSGPWSMVINSDTNDPDVDDSDDHGAITYMNAPDVVLFETTDQFESWYSRTLQPGDSFTVTQVLNQAGTVAEARSLASAAEAPSVPPVPAVTPAVVPSTLTTSNSSIAQAFKSALNRLGSSRKVYTASARLVRGKHGARRVRVRVSGPDGRVRIKMVFVDADGDKVGQGKKVVVTTNRKTTVSGVTVPRAARKVRVTAQ